MKTFLDEQKLRDEKKVRDLLGSFFGNNKTQINKWLSSKNKDLEDKAPAELIEEGAGRKVIFDLMRKRIGYDDSRDF